MIQLGDPRQSHRNSGTVYYPSGIYGPKGTSGWKEITNVDQARPAAVSRGTGDVYGLLRQLPSGLMPDVGATAGYSSQLMLQASPQSRVLAFESFPALSIHRAVICQRAACSGDQEGGERRRRPAALPCLVG